MGTLRRACHPVSVPSWASAALRPPKIGTDGDLSNGKQAVPASAPEGRPRWCWFSLGEEQPSDPGYGENPVRGFRPKGPNPPGADAMWQQGAREQCEVALGKVPDPAWG